MERKRSICGALLFIFLLASFTCGLIYCLIVQEELTCEIIIVVFFIWMIINICKFVAWVTKY